MFYTFFGYVIIGGGGGCGETGGGGGGEFVYKRTHKMLGRRRRIYGRATQPVFARRRIVFSFSLAGDIEYVLVRRRRR